MIEGVEEAAAPAPYEFVATKVAPVPFEEARVGKTYLDVQGRLVRPLGVVPDEHGRIPVQVIRDVEDYPEYGTTDELFRVPPPPIPTVTVFLVMFPDGRTWPMTNEETARGLAEEGYPVCQYEPSSWL